MQKNMSLKQLIKFGYLLDSKFFYGGVSHRGGNHQTAHNMISQHVTQDTISQLSTFCNMPSVALTYIAIYHFF